VQRPRELASEMHCSTHCGRSGGSKADILAT
jgi:hypothetical protein